MGFNDQLIILMCLYAVKKLIIAEICNASSDFRQHPKFELSGNKTKASCLNTKPVWYSDIHCSVHVCIISLGK